MAHSHSHDHHHDHHHGHAHDHGHHGHHHHGHGHGHSHAPANFGAAFAIGVTLNSAFVVAELVFGYGAQSLALISDAVHNLSDVMALLLAWGGLWLTRKQPTDRHTYGYRRASILAALANAALLLDRGRRHRGRGDRSPARAGSGRRLRP